MTKVYKLYGNTATSADALAQLTFSKKGTITAILFACAINSATAVGAARVNLSTVPVSQLTTNDTSNEVATAVCDTAYTTSGGQDLSRNLLVNGIAFAIDVGQRMYLHVLITGTINVSANVYIYVME